MMLMFVDLLHMERTTEKVLPEFDPNSLPNLPKACVKLRQFEIGKKHKICKKCVAP